MDTRLTEIIAQSITAEGKLDRARLYDALSLAKDDPLTLIIEAVLGVEQTIQHQKEQDAGHATAISQVFNANVEQLKTLFTAHMEQVAGAKEQLVTMSEELAGARAKLATDADALTRNSDEILKKASAALSDITSKVEAARRMKIGVLWFASILLGLGSGAGVFFLLKHYFTRP